MFYFRYNEKNIYYFNIIKIIKHYIKKYWFDLIYINLKNKLYIISN